MFDFFFYCFQSADVWLEDGRCVCVERHANLRSCVRRTEAVTTTRRGFGAADERKRTKSRKETRAAAAATTGGRGVVGMNDETAETTGGRPRRNRRRGTAALIVNVAVAALLAAVVCRAPGAGCDDDVTHRRRHVAVILASDVYPGYGVRRFGTADNKGAYFRLLETGFSQYFAVLRDGLLMTTTDVGPLVRRPVELTVLEESANGTARAHDVRVFVLERRDMLRFAADAYPDGRVPENRPAGSRVRGVPVLHAFGEGVAGLPVRYAIVDGNDDGAFALRTANETAIAGNITTGRAYYKGVHLVTGRPLDRERQRAYDLTVRAADGSSIDTAYARVHVDVTDENDNSPVFAHDVYRIDVDGLSTAVAPWVPAPYDNGTVAVGRYSTVGRVSATDADGDRVAYRLVASTAPAVVVVPQTGELLVSDDALLRSDAPFECRLTVDAHDLRTPSRSAAQPATVWIRYDKAAAAAAAGTPADDVLVLQDLAAYDDVMQSRAHHRVYKRRVTRAVRPTKRIEFTETDGEQEGRSVFPLEKETEKETFKIRDENPWVTVEPNGAVRVKKKWDYEELGPEKTIDFWVTITNAGVGGKRTCSLPHHILLSAYPRAFLRARFRFNSYHWLPGKHHVRIFLLPSFILV